METPATKFEAASDSTSDYDVVCDIACEITGRAVSHATISMDHPRPTCEAIE
jgi:hypothetical protein